MDISYISLEEQTLFKIKIFKSEQSINILKLFKRSPIRVKVTALFEGVAQGKA